jgi:hypothetical protein
MKKTHEHFEVYLASKINEYGKILLLNRHTFKIHRGVDNKRALMECVFNYPYLNVTIKYSEEAYQKWVKHEDILPYLVHELCHPITDPLYAKAVSRFCSKDEIEDERERLTDLISHIVLRVIGNKKEV